MDWRADRIGSALRGQNPTVPRRLDAGFANIGDVQFLPGHCAWLYPAEHWTDPATALGPRHDALRAEGLTELDRLRGAG